MTESPLRQCGEITIIPYEVEHFEHLLVRPHEVGIKEAIKLSDTQWARAIKKEAVEAYTAYYNDKIIVIGGMNLLWEHVGEVWAVGSPQIPNQKFTYYKNMKFFLNYFRNTYKLKRVQAQVIADYTMLHEFVKRLGFKYEGTMHNYCGGAIDNCMYAIWE